jgi:hypothetical protein
MLEGWEARKLDAANKKIGFPATVLSQNPDLMETARDGIQHMD